MIDLGHTIAEPNILVVDDEEGVRSYLGRLLTHAGYTVTFAEDGPSAFASVAAAAPDVVLLDVNMPGLSGLDVCRQLRRDTATRLMPIVLITASSEERIHGLDAGADDFLTKPINAQELLARVRALVRLKQYTDDLDSAARLDHGRESHDDRRGGADRAHRESESSSCTSDSPMPVPSCVRERLPRARWNRSNTLGTSAAGMPTPVSFTEQTT